MEIAVESHVIAGVPADSPVARPALPELTQDDPARMFVIIWFNEPATGAVTSIHCTSGNGRAPSGVLETDPDNVRRVISQVCDEGTLDISMVTRGRDSKDESR
jgi:hypothetical protein